jgi:hypothetical protein
MADHRKSEEDEMFTTVKHWVMNFCVMLDLKRRKSFNDTFLLKNKNTNVEGGRRLKFSYDGYDF